MLGRPAIFSTFLGSLLALWIWPVCSMASTEHRVALIIANANYPDAEKPLSHAIRDALAWAEEMRQSGFEVQIAQDVTKNGMRRAVDDFKSTLRPGSTALLFFSGYGIQSVRQSYLIPVDAQIWTEADVRRDGVNIEGILNEMNERGASVKLVIVDASRRNPFERRFRGVSGGLAPVIGPSGSLVMYAAAPGQLAYDAEDGNSLFVGQMLKEIRAVGLSAEEIFNRTRSAVARISKEQQLPWMSSSLIRHFSFKPQPTQSATSAADATRAASAEPPVDAGNRVAPRPPAESIRTLPKVTAQPEKRLAPVEPAEPLSIASRSKDTASATRPEVPSSLGDRAVAVDPPTPSLESAQSATTAAPTVQTPAPAPLNIDAIPPQRQRTIDSKTAPLPAPQAPDASAENRVAMLPPAAAEQPTLSRQPPLSRGSLVEETKKQLKRVGCYAGRIDDKWHTTETSKSVIKFLQYAKLSPPGRGTEPTVEFLEVLRSRSERVCPLECGVREVGRQGRCVTKTCPPGLRLTAGGSCALITARKKLERRASQTRPRADGKCFVFSGQTFCQ